MLKIKGKNSELLKDNIERIMNIACVVCRYGGIPTESDILEPMQSGLYWYECDDVFDILPTTNNYKAFVRSRGENFIVIEFYMRYDKDDKKLKSLTNLLLAFFEDDVEYFNI